MSVNCNNSDISHFDDCIYYDSELRELNRYFKEANDILKRISKRAERRQTTQISKSLFDYVDIKKHVFKVPQTLYDFVYDSVRVCIYFYRGRYSVLVVGFEYPSDFRSDAKLFDYAKLYGSYKTLDECKPFYLKILFYCLNNICRIGDLFEDIPF